jgi:hypothetical protein
MKTGQAWNCLLSLAVAAVVGQERNATEHRNLEEPKCGITAGALAIAMTTNSSFTAFVLHPSASPLGIIWRAEHV